MRGIYCQLLFLMATLAGLFAMNPCATRPCKNKGRCRASGADYTCKCKVDFAGENCEISLANGNQWDKSAYEENEHHRDATAMAELGLHAGLHLPVYEERGGDQTAGHENDVRFQDRRALHKITRMTRDKNPSQPFIVRVSIGTSYRGCFSDTTYSLPQGIGQLNEHSQLTIEMCVVLCRYHQFIYAGLKNGFNCRCRNFFAENSRVSEKDCSSHCFGNGSQICGGPIRVSVYTSCPMFYYGYMCQHRCRCASYQCNIVDGHCPGTGNGCRDGWSGPNCDEYSSEALSLQKMSWYILAGTSSLGVFVFTVAAYFAGIYKMGKVAWNDGGVFERPKETDD